MRSRLLATGVMLAVPFGAGLESDPALAQNQPSGIEASAFNPVTTIGSILTAQKAVIEARAAVDGPDYVAKNLEPTSPKSIISALASGISTTGNTVLSLATFKPNKKDKPNHYSVKIGRSEADIQVPIASYQPVGTSDSSSKIMDSVTVPADCVATPRPSLYLAKLVGLNRQRGEAKRVKRVGPTAFIKDRSNCPVPAKAIKPTSPNVSSSGANSHSRVKLRMFGGKAVPKDAVAVIELRCQQLPGNILGTTLTSGFGQRPCGSSFVRAFKIGETTTRYRHGRSIGPDGQVVVIK